MIKHTIKGILQNILSKITGLSINTVRSYYHSNIKRIDLDVISRICKALDCEIKDVIVSKQKKIIISIIFFCLFFF